MSEPTNTNEKMVTVLGSKCLGHPDGRVAIRLITKELGSVAFEVNKRAIDALRIELATAEMFLRKPLTTKPPTNHESRRAPR